MVRSVLNLPAPAVIMMLMCVHLASSLYVASTLSCRAKHSQQIHVCKAHRVHQRGVPSRGQAARAQVAMQLAEQHVVHGIITGHPAGATRPMPLERATPACHHTACCILGATAAALAAKWASNTALLLTTSTSCASRSQHPLPKTPTHLSVQVAREVIGHQVVVPAWGVYALRGWVGGWVAVSVQWPGKPGDTDEQV